MTDAEVDAVVRMALSEPGADANAAVDAVHSEGLTIHTRRRRITPRSPGQMAYIEALAAHNVVFGIGPAGTGKTYLAVAVAVSRLLQGEVEMRKNRVLSQRDLAGGYVLLCQSVPLTQNVRVDCDLD